MPTWIAICVGASLGALGRWRLGLWLNSAQATLPWGTLAANWIGAYAVGALVVWFQANPGLDPVWRAALITGLLGALTTFSTFSAEALALIQQGRWGWAMLHSGLHLVGSVALAAAGMATAQRYLG
jgi:CrcB protein